ncbi:MAG: hypothetical protein WBV28_10465 [Terracidiphilus sp.]
MLGVEMFGLKPCAQAWIVDFRLALPEVGCEIALNLKMIQLKFNELHTTREITLDIIDPDIQAGDASTLALCFDYHKTCPFV